MGFMRDEFKWTQKQGAWSFGAIVLVLGLPTVLFFQQGVFDEYDYWAGTVSLVVFALIESILFAWVFGMDKGWKEINRGGDIKVPSIYRFIIKFITPVLLLFVFLGSLVTPLGNDWLAAKASLFSGNGWPLDNASLIKQVTNAGLKEQIAAATDPAILATLNEKLFYITGARALLLFTFLAICALVYTAYQNRLKRSK
jgi:hypothetical protein